MGKVRQAKKPSSAPDSHPTRIELCLHEPGMTLLHRAGLGGLAAALRALERRDKLRRLDKGDLPTGPDLGDGYPWRIEPTKLTLAWKEPQGARCYFEKLFRSVFGLKDKLIDLAGTYRDELPFAVRAELQTGLTRTFLQHGNTRSLGNRSIRMVDPTGEGRAQVVIPWRPCLGYKHQSGFAILTNKSGTIKVSSLKIEGPLYPGGAVRHNAFSAGTKLEENQTLVLVLHFALIGCLSLPTRGSAGILLVPDVTDLVAFASARPRMAPTSSRDCRVTSPADAALHAMIRLRGKRLLGRHSSGGIRGLRAIRLAPQKWDKKQKYRDMTLGVLQTSNRAWSDCLLHRFELILSYLPPRLSTQDRETEHEVERNEKKVKVKVKGRIWHESVVRPRIAENLATGNHWYHDFSTLLADRATRTALRYESKGLQQMANDELLEDDELKFVRAIHRAIYMARGKIYAETLGADAAKQKRKPTQAVHNRWNRHLERLRLSLIGAKTRSQVQQTISELLAGTGIVSDLRDDETLRQVKGLLFGEDWQRARNLAMFAVASYKRPSDKESLPGDPLETEDQHSTTE